MIRSLNTGVSGIQQFQERMDVISNNIANVNTTGFKSSRVDFADSFSDTLRSSSASDGVSSGTPGLQIGLGVVTAAIKNSFIQGALSRTGVLTDLAIAGEGFFVVRDPVSNDTFVTRTGDFRLDSMGNLITNGGLRVQGYYDFSDPANPLGPSDIVIDGNARPATVDPLSDMSSFSIGRDGTIKVRLDSGQEYVRGQILLQKFSDPQALMKQGLSLYSGIAAAGPLGGASPMAAPPLTSGLGQIESGALELSNVDLANEFVGMITTQRAYQANARVISTSDEMLQELVNLKR